MSSVVMLDRVISLGPIPETMEKPKLEVKPKGQFLPDFLKLGTAAITRHEQKADRSLQFGNPECSLGNRSVPRGF